MCVNFDTGGQELPTNKDTTIYGTLQIVSDGAYFQCWARLKVRENLLRVGLRKTGHINATKIV